MLGDYVTARPVWTLDTAIDLIRWLQPALRNVGYELGLTGSVLTNAYSRNDLDLIVYPTTTERGDVDALEGVFLGCGWIKRWGRELVRSEWAALDSRDEKHVEVWLDQYGRRVDLFLLR